MAGFKSKHFKKEDSTKVKKFIKFGSNDKDKKHLDSLNNAFKELDVILGQFELDHYADEDVVQKVREFRDDVRKLRKEKVLELKKEINKG